MKNSAPHGLGGGDAQADNHVPSAKLDKGESDGQGMRKTFNKFTRMTYHCQFAKSPSLSALDSRSVLLQGRELFVLGSLGKRVACQIQLQVRGEALWAFGIGLNSRRLSASETEEERKRVSSEMGLPVCDVIRDGPDELVDAVLVQQRTLASGLKPEP